MIQGHLILYLSSPWSHFPMSHDAYLEQNCSQVFIWKFTDSEFAHAHKKEQNQNKKAQDIRDTVIMAQVAHTSVSMRLQDPLQLLLSRASNLGWDPLPTHRLCFMNLVHISRIHLHDCKMRWYLLKPKWHKMVYEKLLTQRMMHGWCSVSGSF